MSAQIFRCRFFRVIWSNDWKGRHPWSDGAEVLPYIGLKTTIDPTHSAGCRVLTFGPIAFLSGFDARNKNKLTFGDPK